MFIRCRREDFIQDRSLSLWTASVDAGLTKNHKLLWADTHAPVVSSINYTLAAFANNCMPEPLIPVWCLCRHAF